MKKVFNITVVLLILVACVDKSKSKIKPKNKQEILTNEIIRKYILKTWISNIVEYDDKFLVLYAYREPVVDISNKFLIQFEEDGELTFENTTKEYECANGIPFIEKATWGFQRGLYRPETDDYDLTNNLVLHIKGGRIAENRFEFKREYKIKSISDDKIELEQIKSMLERYILDGNNFFKQ